MAVGVAAINNNDLRAMETGCVLCERSGAMHWPRSLPAQRFVNGAHVLRGGLFDPRSEFVSSHDDHTRRSEGLPDCGLTHVAGQRSLRPAQAQGAVY